MNKKLLWILPIILILYFLVCIVFFYSDYKYALNVKKQGAEYLRQNSNEILDRVAQVDKKIVIIKPILVFNKDWREKAEFVHKVAESKEIIKEIGGLSGEKTFLVLMQNNAEMRPSGGFWGAYGVLKIRNARIVSFQTGDTYLFDLKSQGKFDPPAETREYFANEWRLWNANWSPDFATAAKQALFFYQQIDSQTKIDGVIGPNVDYLLSLLKSTGPIEVPGYSFNIDENNFVQKMIYEPIDPAVIETRKNDPNFITSNKVVKNMLGNLATTILDKIEADGQEITFARSTNTALINKDLLLYFNQDELQKASVSLNWDGKISGGNSLVVIDANIGSKLDFLISKKSVTKKIGAGLYETTLIYKNNFVPSKESDLFSTYRNLVRIFVPKDSTLVSWSGGQKDVSTSYDQDTNKTVFTNLTILTPDESDTLKFTWQTSEEYLHTPLEIEKQSGNKINNYYVD